MLKLTIFYAWVIANLAIGKKAKEYYHRRAFWTFVTNNYKGIKGIVMFVLFWPCCFYDKYIHEERKFLE